MWFIVFNGAAVRGSHVHTVPPSVAVTHKPSREEHHFTFKTRQKLMFK
jgi:hypothetical protein